ncbi:DUF262 domain-containing protein [Vibrio alginolyticus]|uniref:DUF262 domain-containing protein n=1 Tax=Vibrio TaxID=662 RepID=UPI001BD37797|nr:MULTISPECIES: DUF262 domain-containing protein [Vibrio]MBS9935520.1 DUF262 domain-containing protein [Vibrio alginolyticus]MDW3048688.1 DUF262 domain-containing protein [Vibrio sp. Vb1554]
MLDQFRINPKNTNMPLQVIKDRIDKGYELQELEEDSLSKDEQLKYNDAIIIAPDYQREYRSSPADESSLIESILLGIPIPPIFLASQKLKGVPVLNVVDGQHRLRAFYRYLTNEFKLKELGILQLGYEGKFFNDLEIEEMNLIQSSDISTITFRDFPGENFELEIFSRYNKGTKPLTPQEIRHAVYSSKVNDMVNDFCKILLSEKGESHLFKLKLAYGVSKERYQKKKVQESIFVILSILENGIEQEAKKSPEYAENYMKQKNILEKNHDDNFIDSALESTKFKFSKFNEIIEKLSESTKSPFSKEIYGISSRGNKFQVSISMILASVFYSLEEKINFDYLLQDDVFERFHLKISENLANSYLEDPDYNASTTNPEKIKELTDIIVASLDL